MKINRYIDTERLITEVRLREPLCNLSHVLYKDRDAKLKAWQEVCAAMCPNFDEMSPSDRKEIDKIVQQRWRTARDAYTRSKATIMNTKSGSGGGEIKKKYIYYDDMRFLDKKHTVEVEDSLTADDSQVNILVPEPEPELQPLTSLENTSASEQYSTASTSQTLTSQNKIRRITKSKRSTNKEESDFDKQMLQMLKDNNTMLHNDDMAFFTSLLPITKSFSITQKLTFRSEILKIAMMIHNGDVASNRPEAYNRTYILASPESHSSHSQHITAQEPEQQLTNYFSDMLPDVMASNVEQTDQARGTTDFSDLVVFK